MMDQANKVVSELMANPVNIGLVGLILFLVYKIVRGRKEPSGPVPEPPLAKMKSQDFTLEQLREFDGTGPEGRVLMAVNGKVFDVTRGKNFYGPSKFLSWVNWSKFLFNLITHFYSTCFYPHIMNWWAMKLSIIRNILSMLLISNCFSLPHIKLSCFIIVPASLSCSQI